MTEMSGRQPFDAQQRLSVIGVPQSEIAAMRGFAARDREQRRLGRQHGDVPDFLSGSTFFSGDYQSRVEDDLRAVNARNYNPLYIENVTRTPTRQRLPRRFHGTRINREVKEVLPVEDVAGEIAAYARGVLAHGEPRVTIVDLGAAGSRTLARAARLLDDEISERKVRLIATNNDASPTPQDIAAIGQGLPPDHAADLVRAIIKKSIQFETADALELYQKLQGDPVHLLFMMDVFPAIGRHTQSVLKITNDMLHPTLGTGVYSFVKTGPATENIGFPFIREGLNDLVEQGFQRRYPLQVEPGTVGILEPAPFGVEPGGLQPYEGLEDFPIEVYQGTEAPAFNLYRLGNNPQRL